MNTTKHTRPWTIALWVSAFFMVVPPLLGSAGTILGMIRSFSGLEYSGEASPEALSENISLALNTTIGGLALAALGLIGLVISLVGLHRAKRSA